MWQTAAIINKTYDSRHTVIHTCVISCEIIDYHMGSTFNKRFCFSTPNTFQHDLKLSKDICKKIFTRDIAQQRRHLPAKYEVVSLSPD